MEIVDRFGTTYAVKHWPLGEGTLVYYVLTLADGKPHLLNVQLAGPSAADGQAANSKA